MMKQMLALLLFLLSFTYLQATDSGTKAKFHSYAEQSKKTVRAYFENPSKGNLTILLSDGTVWDCFFKSLSEKQNVLTKIKEDCKAWISPTVSESSSACGMNLFTSSTLFTLKAVIDLTTVENLPQVVNISKGTITLSDGSIWKEDQMLYYSSSYWNVGDSIVVECKNSKKAVLINVCDPRSNFVDTYYANVKMIDWMGYTP